MLTITIVVWIIIYFLLGSHKTTYDTTDTRTRKQIEYDEIIKRKLEQMDKEQDDKAWEDQFGS